MSDIIYCFFAILIGFVYMFITPAIAEKVIEYKNNKRYNENKLVSRDYSKIIFSLFVVVLTSFSIYISFITFPIWKTLFIILFCLISCVATLVDIKVRIIANEMVILLFILGVIYRTLDSGLIGLANGFITVIGVTVFLIISYFFSKSFYIGLQPGGAGDLKLMMAITLPLGYPDILSAFMASVVVMLLYIGFGYLRKKIHLKSYIPMAGFIMFGFIYGLINGGITW